MRLLAGILLGMALCAGCSVSRMAKPIPGTDVGNVQPQRSRASIEAALGAPLKEWTNASGVRFCVYQFSGGYAGSRSEAGAMLFMDVITLGMWEILAATDPDGLDTSIAMNMRKRRLIVSYDPDGVALGMFEEFAILPEDGRSAAPPTSAPRSRKKK